MKMEGDGPQGQPAEGVTLGGLADMLGSDGDAPEESESDEGSEESEEVEASGESEESDDDAASEETQDEDDESTYTLKHEGKEVTVKKSELIALGQKGFDYDKKTMALAEERKAAAQLREEASSFRKQQADAVGELVDRMEAHTRLLQAELGEPPSIELASRDANQYLVLKAAHEGREGKLRQAYTELKALKQDADRERHTALVEEAQATERALVDTLPGWKDAPKERLQATHKYLVDHGLAPDAVPDAFVKKGLWEIAHKAQEYDRIQAEASKVKPKAQPVPKVNKPNASSNQPPQLAAHADKVKAHKANPSLSTLANLL